jgi:hypothetical protein
VYVYNVEECGEHGNSNNADGDWNGSRESVNHEAEPESFADSYCEPESGVESRTRTESEPARQPEASAKS